MRVGSQRGAPLAVAGVAVAAVPVDPAAGGGAAVGGFGLGGAGGAGATGVAGATSVRFAADLLLFALPLLLGGSRLMKYEPVALSSSR